ncbi:MAG: hypothetical protein N4A61_11555 [Pelagimonas sp.]|jgi:hypothetical protein|nr:hypothetical protein [Pelagimonas sp.]
MRKFLNAFNKREDGAVTVDWIVLTAGMVGLCIAAYTAMENSSLALSGATSQAIEERNTF